MEEIICWKEEKIRTAGGNDPLEGGKDPAIKNYTHSYAQIINMVIHILSTENPWEEKILAKVDSSLFTPLKISGSFRCMTDSQSSQLAPAQKKGPKPTGNIWKPSETHPATVPVPLPVVMVRVEGPFTALDRKLWLLLLHHAWDELGSDKPYHVISVTELLRLFRKYGRTNFGARGN